MKINKIGIVLLNYNGYIDTIQCIESLLKIYVPADLAFEYTIIIVDNNSEDESVIRINEWLEEGKGKYHFDSQSLPLSKKPLNYQYINNTESDILNEKKAEFHADFQITLIKNSQNQGFASGNNIGIKSALNSGCSYIWILNNDTIVFPDSLHALIRKAIKLERSKVLVGSVLYFYDRPDQIQAYGGGRFSYITGNSYSLKHKGKFDYLTAASLLVPAAAFKEVGLLDENFFMYWEDTDFCVRAKKKGYHLAVAEDSTVLHKHNSSTNRVNLTNSNFRDIHTARGAIRFYFKHMGPFAALPLFFRFSRAFWRTIHKKSFRAFLVIISKAIRRNK